MVARGQTWHRPCFYKKAGRAKKKMKLYDITTTDPTPTRILVVAQTVEEAKQIARAEGHKVA